MIHLLFYIVLLAISFNIGTISFFAELCRLPKKNPASQQYSGSHNLLVWLNLILYKLFVAISSGFKNDLINFLIMHEFF